MLHRGKIAEMKTGEGKTLVATLPCYLNALDGKGVHVVTVNDYLAKRDSEWMGRLYRFLGLHVGVIVHDLDDEERKAAYNADITYGTNNEFGFDYLRDNMKFRIADCVQRALQLRHRRRSRFHPDRRSPHPADHFRPQRRIHRQVLHASTASSPSWCAAKSSKARSRARSTPPAITPSTKNTAPRRSPRRASSRSKSCWASATSTTPNNIEYNHHVQQALRAHVLYQRDREYVVKDGDEGPEVVIVDEFTGRLMPGRRWSDGLHQAVEAKEGVKIQRENQTLATITFQNYFRMYKKLAGMTGTAETEAAEFQKIYNLDVAVIPTNRAVDPQGIPRRRLPHRGREVPQRRQGDQGTQQPGPAGAGGHHFGGEIREDYPAFSSAWACGMKS